MGIVTAAQAATQSLLIFLTKHACTMSSSTLSRTVDDSHGFSKTGTAFFVNFAFKHAQHGNYYAPTMRRLFELT
ncbi:hypothetical protein V8D89_016343 [Ganoderma adspersum]